MRTGGKEGNCSIKSRGPGLVSRSQDYRPYQAISRSSSPDSAEVAGGGIQGREYVASFEGDDDLNHVVGGWVGWFAVDGEPAQHPEGHRER